MAGFFLGVDFRVLRNQRRMRPEICRLSAMHYPQGITDDITVQRYDQVRGVPVASAFINHQHPETVPPSLCLTSAYEFSLSLARWTMMRNLIPTCTKQSSSCIWPSTSSARFALTPSFSCPSRALHLTVTHICICVGL